MKKILLIAALSAACLTMSAQQKGDMAVGGVIGISGGSSTTKATVAGNSTSTTSPAATTLTFNPEFSYFAADRLELSIGVSYDMLRSQSGTSNDKKLFTTRNLAMLTLGVNYYLPLVDGAPLYYTPGISLGFGGGSTVRQTSASSKTTTSIPFAMGIDLELGKIEFKPLDFLGIYVNLLDLNISNVTRTDTVGNEEIKYSSTDFTASMNYGITAGVKYYF